MLMFLPYYNSNAKIQYSVLYAPGFKKVSRDLKAPEIRQSKSLLVYCQELDRLLIEEHGQLLCCDEPLDALDEENLRICLPSTLFSFLACFRMGHYNELGGHMGASKTYANAK